MLLRTFVFIKLVPIFCYGGRNTYLKPRICDFSVLYLWVIGYFPSKENNDYDSKGDT